MFYDEWELMNEKYIKEYELIEPNIEIQNLKKEKPKRKSIFEIKTDKDIEELKIEDFDKNSLTYKVQQSILC